MARQKTPTTSVTNAPAIIVPGAFTGGGAQADRLQTEAHIALNDIVSWSKGKHEIRTGINVPDISRRGLNDRTNSLGTYQFATLADFQQNAATDEAALRELHGGRDTRQAEIERAVPA